MEFHELHYHAPDPLTEPEKCSGIRCSFWIIAVFGVLIFACAALALYSPRVYALLKSTSDFVSPASGGDPLPLEHSSGAQPVFH